MTLNLNEPSVMYVHACGCLSFNEPSVTYVHASGCLRLNEPSVTYVHACSCLSLNEPSVTYVHACGCLRFNEPSVTYTHPQTGAAHLRYPFSSCWRMPLTDKIALNKRIISTQLFKQFQTISRALKPTGTPDPLDLWSG